MDTLIARFYDGDLRGSLLGKFLAMLLNEQHRDAEDGNAGDLVTYGDL